MPKIIGIAGGSASGKSTFAKKLTEMLETASGNPVKIIPMDQHYKKKEDRPYLPSPVNGKYYIDNNSPDAIDWVSFHTALAEAAEETSGILLIEGFFALSEDLIKTPLDLKIFVDCPADERIVRRLKRNMTWGLTFDEISSVYLDMVRFRHAQFVEPCKWTADLIVNGSGNTDQICRMICKSLTESWK